MATESAGAVTVLGNRVIIQGPVLDTDMTRRIVAAMRQAAESGVDAHIVLDFSECSLATQAAMLPLLAFANRFRAQTAREIVLRRPRRDAVDRDFTNGNWAHIIDPVQFAGDSGYDDALPALQFESEEEAGRIPDRISEIVMRSTAVGPKMLRTLGWSLLEILDNVINHSQSRDGGFVQAIPLTEHAEFIVADAGIGIAESLGIEDHVDALREAVKAEVTRDKESNQGNGLYGSLQAAVNTGGDFELASGHATLRYPPDANGDALFDYDLPYPGTVVRARIGLAESGVLQDILRVKGHDHDPGYGYVEKRFETDAREFVFSIKEHAARDVGSRGGGRRVRQQLENLLQEAETITVDFAGVEVISSSFADEVFGRLFVSLGPRYFKRLILTNANEDIEGLIDRATVLRWRTATSS